MRSRNLGDVARRVGRFRTRSGDGQAQQHRVGPHLVLEHLERFRGAALVDQEIGIRRGGVGIGAELQDAAVGGIGLRRSTVALLELGERCQQPALRARRRRRIREQPLEGLARRRHVTAQRGVLGQAGARVQLRPRCGDVLASRIGIGVVALHAQHGRQREPGLCLPFAAAAGEQLVQGDDRSVEFVQILLQRRSHQHHRIGRGARVGPWLQRCEREAGEARIAGFAGTVEIPAWRRSSPASRRAGVRPAPCAGDAPRRGCRPWRAARR